MSPLIHHFDRIYRPTTALSLTKICMHLTNCQDDMRLSDHTCLKMRSKEMTVSMCSVRLTSFKPSRSHLFIMENDRVPTMR